MFPLNGIAKVQSFLNSAKILSKKIEKNFLADFLYICKLKTRARWISTSWPKW